VLEGIGNGAKEETLLPPASLAVPFSGMGNGDSAVKVALVEVTFLPLVPVAVWAATRKECKKVKIANDFFMVETVDRKATMCRDSSLTIEG